MPAKTRKKYHEAVGRRKAAVARVRLFKQTKDAGTIVVNEKDLKLYFPPKELASIVESPFEKTGTEKKFYTTIKVYGGGTKSQAEAIRLGISRALLKTDDGLRPALKSDGLLTRDSRIKERKKFGLKKARKSPQWSKR